MRGAEVGGPELYRAVSLGLLYITLGFAGRNRLPETESYFTNFSRQDLDH